MPKPPFFPQILDYIYLSFVTYTTVGYGDVLPVGLLRLYTGLEALTGVIMLGWTAAFTFIEMQRIWNLDFDKKDRT